MKNNINRQAIFIFIVLAIIWGTSFILIKKSLGVFSPIQLGSLRIIITFFTLAPFAWKYLKKVRFRDAFILTISAFVGSFFPAYLFAFAQQGINSSTAGILNSLTPLFALLFGVLFFKFQARWWNYLGIIISLTGTYGLLSVSGGQSFGFNIQYGGLVLIASLGYGLQVNIIKYYLSHLPSFTIVVLQFFIIFIPAVLVLLFATDFVKIMSLEKEFIQGMMYVSILAIIATAFALILFYRLIKMVDPVFSSSVTYFIPAIATLWGLFDGESIGLSFVFWVTLILLGVFAVNTKKKFLFFK